MFVLDMFCSATRILFLPCLSRTSSGLDARWFRKPVSKMLRVNHGRHVAETADEFKFTRPLVQNRPCFSLTPTKINYLTIRLSSSLKLSPYIALV